MHYRRTGRFCNTMWHYASNDNLRRYCLGYASHIATDVVGHSFVNAVVGGPYRTHWHRHKLVENWIDAYARNKYPDSADTLRCLRLGGEDKYIPNAISGSYYYRLCEFPDGRLPRDLKQMFISALEATYHDIPHPPNLRITPVDDLEAAYRLWLMWFKRTTSARNVQPPIPVDHPGSAAEELINDYISGLPPFSVPGGGGGFSVWDIFAAIFAFVTWLVSVVVYTVTWIIDHASEIALLPLETVVETIRWLLYQIRQGLWAPIHICNIRESRRCMAGTPQNIIWSTPEPYGRCLLRSRRLPRSMGYIQRHLLAGVSPTTRT